MQCVEPTLLSLANDRMTQRRGRAYLTIGKHICGASEKKVKHQRYEFVASSATKKYMCLFNSIDHLLKSSLYTIIKKTH